MAADLISVTRVTVLGHYRLRLTFSDGRVGDVDVSGLREKGGMFTDLRDPSYFKRVRVDPEVGTIAWPNGLDLAPERLYDEARTVPPAGKPTTKVKQAKVPPGIVIGIGRSTEGAKKYAKKQMPRRQPVLALARNVTRAVNAIAKVASGRRTKI